MPFLGESVRKLRDRLGMSQYTFSVALGESAKEISATKTSYTPNTIRNWEKGVCSPGMNFMDTFVNLALREGHGDLPIYVWP